LKASRTSGEDRDKNKHHSALGYFQGSLTGEISKFPIVTKHVWKD